MRSVYFGAWSRPESSQTLRQLAEQVEESLESAPPAPSVNPIENRPAEHQGVIRELQDTLQKVTANNGYGMKDAINILRVLRDTGYRLTPEEDAKLKMLVRKSDYNLFEHLSHFPKSGYHDYPDSRQTQDDLNLLLPVWVREQTGHQPLRKLVDVIDRSAEFTASEETRNAIERKLQELMRQLQDAEFHKAYLKQLGGNFRPKSKMVEDIRQVFETLFPSAGSLFEAESEKQAQQAVDLIARRSTQIDFAGRTAKGELYIVTSSTDRQNSRTDIYMGAPGNIRQLEIKDGSRAMNGSDTVYITKDNVRFQFKRGGLSNHNDKSLWEAYVNGERVPQEFPTDELHTR